MKKGFLFNTASCFAHFYCTHEKTVESHCVIHFQNLFNLQHVRGNFPKLHTAFKELNNIARDVSSRVSSGK